MIFLGDIALPYIGAINYHIPDFFSEKHVIANLEGALVTDTTKFLKHNLVVNDFHSIENLNRELDIHFSLNNNHILDNGNFQETENNARLLKLSTFGAGSDINKASEPLIISSEKSIILNFGWNTIECIYARKNKAGVNPLEENYVLSEYEKYRNLYPDYKIICFFHWDYELEKYPMPSQRDLSFRLIDKDCDAIIGCHPHRIQGYETYRNKPIIYSLGNWLFAQGVYRNGNLKFPDFCNLELAFEYKDSGNHLCHFFKYNKDRQELSFYKTEPLHESKILGDLTPFKNMTSIEYEKWFKVNRFHKKAIPIYKSSDGLFERKMKNLYNTFRTALINFLVSFNLKK
ncbi:CapA family protein [Tamlana sp. 2201CG12-4]|uniref:CapA family protein n=1 Tax=Tamlana sp. 2201CG12-4 TaxID=3112582 RepID=UPI002DBE24D4|nr:CapA family protein [Tamlana sp. 2201CG12-4]MEC3906308.1 CapA family protein [Tamlana sp. 2201CG12-4]